MAVDEAGIDRLLGLITEAVVGVRGHAAKLRGAEEPQAEEPPAGA